MWQKVTFNGEVKSLLEVSKISETGRQMGDGEEAPCQNKGVDDMEVDDWMDIYILKNWQLCSIFSEIFKILLEICIFEKLPAYPLYG